MGVERSLRILLGIDLSLPAWFEKRQTRGSDRLALARARENREDMVLRRRAISLAAGVTLVTAAGKRGWAGHGVRGKGQRGLFVRVFHTENIEKIEKL